MYLFASFLPVDILSEPHQFFEDPFRNIRKLKIKDGLISWKTFIVEKCFTYPRGSDVVVFPYVIE